ncbi:amidohydrolase family protein [Paenibacillus sp. HB172176]|uniref:amidohydrolase family protein n=1 Tax=Paenibacillus sp. HB172176 TaxID=2493690 RepID=UPI0014389547|nr:amidohydrolase family protein [Paenibacillus sp. HB172176]
MAKGDLHVINAKLPLGGDADSWHELIAEGGCWKRIIAHPQRLSLDDAVSIRDRRSLEQGAPGRLPAIVDLEGRIALPGFVDMHMHLDKALTLDQVGNSSGTLLEAIANYSGKAGEFSKANIRERMVRTALMGLRHGTTAMRTHLDMPAHLGREVLYRTIEAALEAREELKGRVKLQLFPMLSFARDPEGAKRLSTELIGLGMDGIGGCPHLMEDPSLDVKLLFKQAEKLGVPVDLHVDETDNPSMRTIETICHATIAAGYEGKVTAGHLCSLSSMPKDEARLIIELMAQAKVGAVTLPAVNLYLQGRGDEGPVRRGVTRVKEMLEDGVEVAAASDNIQDPFHPFGRGDLLHIGAIAAYAAHMGAASDAERILDMITQTPAALMGLREYGMRQNHQADIVVLDATTPEQLLLEESPSRWVAVNGTWASAHVREVWLD